MQVKTLPANVCATITPHHLALTIDQAIASSLNFCKPLAQFPSDRAALRAVIASGHPQFFLGSDSAPHASGAKLPALRVTPTLNGEEEITLPTGCAAGIYTQPHLVPLVAHVFEASGIPLERMAGFCSEHGRRFYGVPAKEEDAVVLRRVTGGKDVPKTYAFKKEAGQKEYVIPFMAGEKLDWEIQA